MRKIYYLVLIAAALLVGTNAWAETRTAGTFQQLQDALSNANPGDVIELTADIDYGYSQPAGAINITKSITIDGQGHTLTGASSRPDGQTSQWATIWVCPESMIDATIKNINIVNAYSSNSNPYIFAIQTRKNINSLTIENAVLDIRNGGRGNSAPFQMGGSDTNLANITIKNSKLLAKNSDYPVLTWVPASITAKDSYFNGYCGLYFKAGSAGSVVNADACDFDAPNVHDYSGGWNNFGVFATEDANITINLHNCGMNAQETGFKANQGMILPKQVGCVVNISGDNSHINGRMVLDDASYPGYFLALLKLTGGLTITGGTYSVDPSHYGPYNPYTWFGDQDPTLPDEDLYANFVPDGYEVKEITMEGVATSLYRVVKKAEEKAPGVMYDLNDLVAGEGVDEGNNPVSSFDLSTGTDMTLNQETTTAGYVQVKDNATEGATTVTIGTPSQDQTLVINNGLDVQGESQVIVQAGSTLEIGEGGINTEQPSNIVIGADENGAASLIMDPTITVNQTPNLTVKMKAKNIGWIMASGKEYYWHRFALPIQQATTWVKNPNKSTYVFGWNYSANDWEQLSALTQMVPFQGYTLSADYEATDINNLHDIEYTFTGQLAGNTNNALNFQRNGFNFFGNSYTGYIDILALVDQIMGDSKIDGTVWVWGDDQQYHAVPLMTLREGGDVYATEIAPMQTFILKQNGGVNATTELNYASAIWGNPRYGHNTSSPAPQRIQNDETARMRIIVKAENGKSDFVMLTEDGRFSDDFEKGYDGEKYMNENTLNMYATVNDVDYSAVATDDLAGKTLTIQTVASVNYTMSFAKVRGETYAIRDLMTNIVTPMTEGNTYTFAAQPNTTIEGRFVIVPMQNMPTDVETVETTPAVKGIYTIMGQYVGEDFDILPAGIYVVDGVKIVK